MSRSKDIAEILGLTEAENTTNASLGDGSGGGGSVTTYATPANLPTSGNTSGDQAFVTSNNRLYIWNGSGWYNIALVNTNPSFSSSPDDTYILAEGTATVITLVATDPEGVPITYTTTTDAGFDGIATVSNDSSVFTITPLSSPTTSSGNLTFKASDGVNLASEVSEFTLKVAVQNSAPTAVLAKASGNAGTNSTFTDGSTNSHTITTVGDAYSSSFVPHHPGGYSAYFDGTGDSLQLTTSGDLQAIGRSGAAATIEAWVYLNSAPSSDGTAVYSQGTAGSTSGSNIISFEIQNNRTLRGMVNGGYSNTSGCPISTGTVPLKEWTHIALVLNSGTWTLYINGTADGTATGSYPSGTSHSTAYIGRIFYGDSRTGDMYVRDLRITSTAVYTAAFTPLPGTLTAITDTKLLTCHLPYFADGSSSDYTITPNGDAGTERFGPYDYAEYSAASHGSSVYFDGNGDYLTVADDDASFDLGAPADGDFTIEGWLYPTELGDYDTVIAQVGTWAIEIISSKLTLWLSTGTGGSWDILSAESISEVLQTNEWVHFALVRNGSTLTSYINGISEYSATVSGHIGNSSNSVQIGYYSSSSHYWNGYMQDIRIVKGTAVYTSAFTPPTEPLTAITNTKMLLTASPSVYNAAGLSNSIKLYGNTQSSTTQTKNASSSIYFDGSGDYATIEDNKRFEITSVSDAFTAECWVYPTGSPAQPIIFGQWTSPQSWGILLSNDSNRYARLIFHDGSYRDTTTSTAIALNAWTHLALVKTPGTGTSAGQAIGRLYVNGTLAGTRTGMGALTGGDNTLSIGANASGSYGFQGYIEDARFTPGLARYPFVPPKETLAAVSNTKLLTAHSETITDGSTSSHTVTTYGDAAVSNFAPTTDMKSIYLDGTGDYLTIASSTDFAMASNDFTIEFWYYPTSISSSHNIHDQRTTDSQAVPWIGLHSNGYFYYYVSGANRIAGDSGTVTANKWYHVAISRVSGTTRLFVNGQQAGSDYSDSTSYAQGGTLYIGKRYTGSALHPIGYLSNYRIVNGTGIYADSFTPPTGELTG